MDSLAIDQSIERARVDSEILEEELGRGSRVLSWGIGTMLSLGPL